MLAGEVVEVTGAEPPADDVEEADEVEEGAFEDEAEKAAMEEEDEAEDEDEEEEEEANDASEGAIYELVGDSTC